MEIMINYDKGKGTLVFTSTRPGLDFKRWMPGLEDVHTAALQAAALCGGCQGFRWVVGNSNILKSVLHCQE